MKWSRSLVVLTLLLLVPLGVLAGALPASAQSPAAPSWSVAVATPGVFAVDPPVLPNDIHNPVTITGYGFAGDASGTIVPVVSVGTTLLTDVVFVSDTTLVATVPWGMVPGTYQVTVTNPGGLSGSLPAGLTITQGIGLWNSGDLFGGDVLQVLLKPSDPSTVYALASGVGLFRSRDAGGSWAFISGDVIGNADFVVDSKHPAWLYSYRYGDQAHEGLWRSTDEGDTWTRLLATWPDGSHIDFAEVYPSPSATDTIFVGAGRSLAGGAAGLVKSTDGGATWRAIPSVEGTQVQDVAFDPASGSSKMALVTYDGRVLSSDDDGETWVERRHGLTRGGRIAYNPDTPDELWVTSPMGTPCVYKTTDPTMALWDNVTPADVQEGSGEVRFTPGCVYIPGHRWPNGATGWEHFGPAEGYGTPVFAPTPPLQLGFCGGWTDGVQKTTDGGVTWNASNAGLSGMRVYAMEVSRSDPLRVYATFPSSHGLRRSDDGTGHWADMPIADSGNVWQAREDPFDPQRLYVAADDAFYVMESDGTTWTPHAWGTPNGMHNQLAADPFTQGHVLAGFRVTDGDPSHVDSGALYETTDSGDSWHLVSGGLPAPLGPIVGIAFDPAAHGTVYLVTDGTGVYKSTDHGGSWNRTDAAYPGMARGECISIATAPVPMVLVTAGGFPWLSRNGGATWAQGQPPDNSGLNAVMFANGDSNRLYAAAWSGLWFSGNAGASWARASGVMGQVNTTALGSSYADGHVVVYAATCGGVAPVSSLVSSGLWQSVLAPTTLVDAGVYRWVSVARATSITIRTTATTSRIGRVPILSGAVTPPSMIGKNIVVWVKKPGRSYYSYSSNRTVYSLNGSPAWQYKYYFKPGMARGTYYFKATCPAPGFGYTDFLTSTSRVIAIRLY